MEPEDPFGIILLNLLLNLLGADPPPKAKRAILCLDEGGVKCLSSLWILKTLMEEIKARSVTNVSRPWECFDLIGGTGFGGLIAIMLGRLRMVSRY